MATNFPTSLDSFTNPVAGDSLASPSHAGQHADVNDAVEALQVKVGVGAHTLGEWTSFTPVFTNFTLGNGTVSAKYCQVNDLVFVEMTLALGSTSAMTGQITMDTPVGTAVVTQNYRGDVRMRDASPVVDYVGAILVQSTTAYIYRYSVSGSQVFVAGISATSPFTWTTSDTIRLSYWYQKG